MAGGESTRKVLKGPIEIPAAIPAGVAGVLLVRVPVSLFASVMAADPLGLATGDLTAMKAELDGYLRTQLGITMTDATTVAGFAMDKENFGLVLVGVQGSIKGTKVSVHEGVDLYSLAGSNTDLRLAATGDLLILGSETAVKAALDANSKPDKSMKNADALAKLLKTETEGAAFAMAVDVANAPTSIRSEIPPTMKLDRGLITFGERGLTVMLEGEKDSLDEIAALIELGLSQAVAEAERAKARATSSDSSEGVAAGAAAIVAAHYMKRTKETLKPTIADGRISVSIPFKAGDPAILAAVAGIGAAIAIPALTKYMRRSKTSEARVQLAKMFDGASAYFNEERVSRPLTGVPTMPHGCPNNGKLEGESGITPPLSFDCNQGPGGRCVPTVGGGGSPGYYEMTAWLDNDVWNGLNFQIEQAHFFHYNFKYKNTDGGFGTCQFTAQAFADLDGDGVFSTYERAGAADENGVNTAAGLYIDQELE